MGRFTLVHYCSEDGLYPLAVRTQNTSNLQYDNDDQYTMMLGYD